MFGRAIWGKLLESIFESFEIARAKQEQFQNFQKPRGWFISRTAQTKHVITGYSYQTKKHFVLKAISFKCKQLQISERAITKQRTRK